MDIKSNYSYSFKARIMLKPINKKNGLGLVEQSAKYKYKPVRNNIFSKIIKYFFKKQMKIQLKDPS